VGVEKIPRSSIDVYTYTASLYDLFHPLYPFIGKVFHPEHLHHKAPTHFVVALLNSNFRIIPGSFFTLNSCKISCRVITPSKIYLTGIKVVCVLLISSPPQQV
jgi:hypothetical protein